MVVVMYPDSPPEDVSKIKERIKSLGCKPHEIYGEDNIAIAVLGNTKDLVKEELAILPSVQHGLRVSKK